MFYLLDYMSLIQVKNVVIFDDFYVGTSVSLSMINVKYLKELSDVQFYFFFFRINKYRKIEVEKTIKMNKHLM